MSVPDLHLEVEFARTALALGKPVDVRKLLDVFERVEELYEEELAELKADRAAFAEEASEAETRSTKLNFELRKWRQAGDGIKQLLSDAGV